MKQDIYKKGENKQYKMDIQSHKDLLKKSQEHNRTEWMREHTLPYIYLISPSGPGLAVAVTWWGHMANIWITN